MDALFISHKWFAIRTFIKKGENDRFVFRSVPLNPNQESPSFLFTQNCVNLLEISSVLAYCYINLTVAPNERPPAVNMPSA